MAKTAVITGASRGIGAACASALADDGYELYLIYNSSEKSANAVAEKTRGTAIQCDVSDSSAVKRVFASLPDADLLVCCAGVAHYGLFADITDDEWRHVFDVNAGGVINCCRAVIPSMVRRKTGNIITVSSVWGLTGASCEAVYSSSKAAVIGLTKSLAKELGPSGIRVNCIAPGVIDTDMLATLTSADLSALRAETPLGRIGSPEDTASVVRFLASDAAGFITGQVINVSGGFLM